MAMKGIILAGGTGTRLYPMTHAVSQAAAAGLRQADDLLSAVDADAGRHPRHPDHHHAARPAAVPSGCWATAASGACDLRYAAQPKPEGLAQAFLIGRDFIAGDRVRAGARRQHLLRPRPVADCSARPRGTARARPSSPIRCTIPERYGVVEFDARRPAAVSIEEKPQQPKSQLGRDRALFLRQPGGRHRRAA